MKVKPSALTAPAPVEIENLRRHAEEVSERIRAMLAESHGL